MIRCLALFIVALSASSARADFVTLPDGTYKWVTGGDAPPTPRRAEGGWTYKSPVGHTHTCANGHTWDHGTNPTHVCQYCGQQQFVQDQSARMVTVWNAAQPSAAPSYTLPGTLGSGGCANGQCASPSTRRWGLFRR